MTHDTHVPDAEALATLWLDAFDTSSGGRRMDGCASNPSQDPHLLAGIVAVRDAVIAGMIADAEAADLLAEFIADPGEYIAAYLRRYQTGATT